MLAQSNPVDIWRRAVPLNLSHAPRITDTPSPLRIMDLYEQNVTDRAAAWVSEKPRQPMGTTAGVNHPARKEWSVRRPHDETLLMSRSGFYRGGR
jgi:hypothetical protein